MRRLILALFGAVALTASLMPVGAHASTSQAALLRTVSAAGNGSNPTILLSTASKAQARQITLSQDACNALSGGLSRRAKSCTVSAGIRLTGKSADGSVFYWNGYLQACAVTEPGGCSTKNWWVKDYFKFVQNQTGSPRAWAYGSPSCSAHGTNIKWCGYVSNGTKNFQEGFNFGNGGWARMDTDGNWCSLDGPSWANVDGYEVSEDTGPGGACPYLPS